MDRILEIVRVLRKSLAYTYSAFAAAIGKLGSHKDGITVGLALVISIGGVYQYFGVLADKRIQNALDLLARRETSTFVEARTLLISKWTSNTGMLEQLRSSKHYTNSLIEAATDEIFSDDRYIAAIHNISTYYTNSAACTLDGVCDASVMCGSLAGEIQDYLEVNRGYFAYLTSIRGEDAKSLTLSLPEFVEFCLKNDSILIASRHDRSFSCQLNLSTNRLLGFHIGETCQYRATDYDRKLVELAEKS